MTFAQIRNYIKGLFNPIVDELKQDIEDAKADYYTKTKVDDLISQIDTSPYSGFTPIGTVISVMGNHAPLHYLICDGSTYNISQYPDLADYFKKEFGTKNYFGGNGTTTFAVPDLRGEFLRGTGTNSHANQGSGSSVGGHQDATEHPYVQYYVSGTDHWYATSAAPLDPLNVDKYVGSVKSRYILTQGAGSSPYANATTYDFFTSKPTNTSVLYCIATCNIYIDSKNNYSAQETVIGTWIDGKPLYQKTINFGALPGNAIKTVAHGIANLKRVVSLNGCAYANASNKIYHWPLPGVAANVSSNTIVVAMLQMTDSDVYIRTNTASLSAYTETYVTAQYTKTTD